MKISKFLLVGLALTSGFLTTNAQSISVKSTDYQQVIDMMGGDMERSAAAVQSSKNTQEIIDWGFKDIEFNYCRVQYDKNQELVEGRKNWGFYSKQIVTMKQIKEINPDIKFFATMRTDYDGFGNDNNAPDWAIDYNTKKIDIDKYTRFLADYLEYMHDQGLTIHTFSITKEWTSYVYASRAAKIIPKLHAECDARGVPRAKISDQGFWSMKQGVNYIDDVAELGTEDLYDSFCSHDYDSGDSTTWETIVGKANALGKKLYHDEFSTGAGAATNGVEPPMSKPIGVYFERIKAYDAGLSGEIFFEIWSRGVNRETRSIYSPWQGTGERLRGYYLMKQFANNILDSRYMPTSVSSASNVRTMAFRKGNKMVLWVINKSTTNYNALPITMDASTITSSVRASYWTNSTSASGATRTYTASGDRFSPAIAGESMNCFIFNVSEDDDTPVTISDFTPDPNKSYYLDVPEHNVRLAADGESEAPYTASTNTTGADVEWQFVKADDRWYLRRAAGGSLPALRTDNSASADMQSTGSTGGWTKYSITDGASSGTYFLTIPNGPSNHSRLQIDRDLNINMVDNTRNGSWESFRITEVSSSSSGTTPQAGKTYYIDNPHWDARLAANGGVTPYLKDPNANYGNLVSWRLTAAPTAGYYYIDGVGGEDTPRLSTDLTENAAVRSSSFGGSWTQWKLTPMGDGTFTLTTLVAGDFCRLQVTNTGEIKMVSTMYTGDWTRFTFTESRSAKNLADLDSNFATVYPNPIATSTTIEGAADTTLTIYNMNGSLLHSQSISSESETIDLSGLATGVYYAEIKGTTKIDIVKLVKL